jgi:hypothetical protein
VYIGSSAAPVYGRHPSARKFQISQINFLTQMKLLLLASLLSFNYAVPAEVQGGPVNTVAGISTLPTGYMRPFFKQVRKFFFYGEVSPKVLTPGNRARWMQVLGHPAGFKIVTKDDVKLDTLYIPKRGARRTMIFFSGMLEGGEGVIETAGWFYKQTDFNILIVTRRGYRGSEGSSIESGELGVYYDVQAAISYLVKRKSQPLKSLWINGYGMGGTYATIGATFFPEIAAFILDRSFPDYFSFASHALPYVPKALLRPVYNKVFSRGAIDEIPPNQYFVEPSTPFSSSGMSIVNMFKDSYDIPDAFFMLGSDDGVIPQAHKLELINSYVGASNFTLEQYTALSDIMDIGIGHTQSFANDDVNKDKLLAFIKKHTPKETGGWF